MSIKGNIELCFGNKDTEDFDLTFIENNISEQKCKPHWHDCFEILLILTGKCEVTICNEQFILNKGDVAVIPPRMTHSTYSKAEWNYSGLVYGYTEYVIYSPDLSISNLNYLSPFRAMRKPYEYILPADSEQVRDIRETMLKGFDIFKTDSPLRTINMRKNILELHSVIYSLYAFREKMCDVPKYLLDTQKYIEEHLPCNISPYEIAREIHISYSHLSRIVKNYCNMTISQLITSMRIDLAEQIFISDNSINVTECAMKVGFSDVSYFINKFKKAKGISPGEYLKLLKRS